MHVHRDFRLNSDVVPISGTAKALAVSVVNIK